MNEISDEQKLQWLTTSVPPRKRAMINTDGFEGTRNIPNYTVTPLRRQIPQPSFGHLAKLPPELSNMVFSQLTCEDLEALHSCSTGGRLAVLAFLPYQNLLQHSPTILAILKQTELAGSFTIKQIYEVFKSPLCTTCGQFGGYVFLPSFDRCCLYCAEMELKFLPMSSDGAKFEFGVKGRKIMDSLPHLKNIKGYYSTLSGEIRFYSQRLILYSREMVEKLRDPNHAPVNVRQDLSLPCKWIKGYQRYMALTALPCFLPSSASVERGVYCAGCKIRAVEHNICRGLDLAEWLELDKYNTTLRHYITDGFNPQTCGRPKRFGPFDQCSLMTARHRLHDSRHVLGHLEGCEAAQALLQVRWTLSQETVSETDLIKFSSHPCLQGLVKKP